MPTLGQVVQNLEAGLFVGRERELAAFSQWLADDQPAILNVSGPGGVGKTALLRAFRRYAEEQGRPVVTLDARDFRATPEGLWHALGGDSAAEVLAALNAQSPLLLLDTFEELGQLTRYLQDEFLPQLDSALKIVIAGRYPLEAAWSRDEFWRSLIRPLPLQGFSDDESRVYLRRRGLKEQRVVKQIGKVAGGYPLALSLAADLALQFGSRDIAAAPEWRLALRALVERLLQDSDDPTLRELLEACAVVRQFDEAMLAAVAGRADVSDAFARLCRLSVVRPAEHGLMLHDDVRRILVDDLRWRAPERYAALRGRALAHYRERVRTARPADQEWLMAERFFLWEHGFVQAMLFNKDEYGEVWLEPGAEADHEEVLRLEAIYQDYIAPAITPAMPFTAEERAAHMVDMAAFLRSPGARLRVARDRTGQAVGFSLILPVAQESLAPLIEHPVLGPLIRAYWSPAERAALPATAESSTIFYLVQVVFTIGQSEVTPEAINSAVIRDLFSVLVRNGIYLTTTGTAMHQQLLQAFGFEPIPTPPIFFRGVPMQGFLLDLTQIGVEAWIEAIMAGRRPPRALRPAELERALQDALLHWHDDARLSCSPLRQTALVDGEAAGPAELRAVLQAALARAKERAGPGEEAAYRALELGYLTRGLAHERAAERLSVSRTTFYRLLKRGVQGLARALAAR